VPTVDRAVDEMSSGPVASFEADGHDKAHRIDSAPSTTSRCSNRFCNGIELLAS
jgi:hypothetical protein